MSVEIERKFLVTHNGRRKPESGQQFCQGYFCKGELTVWVRRTASRRFLTIKWGGNGPSATAR
jgi:adenylate cyclase